MVVKDRLKLFQEGDWDTYCDLLSQIRSCNEQVINEVLQWGIVTSHNPTCDKCSNPCSKMKYRNLVRITIIIQEIEDLVQYKKIILDNTQKQILENELDEIKGVSIKGRCPLIVDTYKITFRIESVEDKSPVSKRAQECKTLDPKNLAAANKYIFISRDDEKDPNGQYVEYRKNL